MHSKTNANCRGSGIFCFSLPTMKPLMNPAEIKKALQTSCLRMLEEKQEMLQQSIEQARAAQQGDTKSSAGDKFETTREMMSQEIDKLSRQLAELLQQKKLLSSLNPERSHDIVQAGSIIDTSTGAFYLSVSAGSFEAEGKSWQLISAQSPVGKALLGKKKGEQVSWNKHEALITFVG